ncbi:Nitroreductase domain-containing protein [Vibrio chagasii]|nr:Nitroreductase domain-containing protein [Vibrio chagasii]CAH7100580.1 Nitroreductase domain-containing protein [Vibrio chagasii]CAH7413722.1 Nitroreductase domain-containing protein [Vibrio chagasii]CAH7474421.1 Nitroreductase domain-containing protein [Vibrio chagasii]
MALFKIKKKLRLLSSYVNDYNVYKSASLMNSHRDVNGTHALGLIIRLYHTIEKGLSIDPMKLEFSLANVQLLQDKLLSYTGDKNEAHIKSAIVTLASYFNKHPNDGLSNKFLKERDRFHQLTKWYKLDEISVGGGVKEYFKNEPLDNELALNLVRSRTSVRDFDNSRSVDFDELIKVIDVAKRCPSACNRHAIKIYHSLDVSQNEKILELQNGSRTFRHNVPGLMVITSDLRYQEGVEERNLGYIEGGIWLMSIVNSLHLHGFSSCVLNWCVSPKVDRDLKDFLSIPNYHQISGLVAFGYSKPFQKVPYSIRCSSEEFLSKIKING